MDTRHNTDCSFQAILKTFDETNYQLLCNTRFIRLLKTYYKL